MKLRGLKEFNRDLAAVADLKTIHVELKDVAEKELINAIIGSAKAGIGPGNNAYPPYSESYAKVVEKSGVTKLWLRGIGKSGRSGGMLDPSNFHIEIQSDGRAFLVWDGGQDYAKFHQEGDGKIPQRKFVHFENTRNQQALLKAYRIVFDRLIAKFNTGQRVG